MENKPASLLVVSLGKTLNGMPPSSCGRQVAGPSSLPVVVPQSNERHANRAWAHTNQKKVKAGIKSITKRNAQHQLKNVRVSWITIRKLKNRNTAFLESNRGLYRSSSDKLCNIGAADVIETIQKKLFNYARSKTRRHTILYWSIEGKQRYNEWWTRYSNKQPGKSRRVLNANIP